MHIEQWIEILDSWLEHNLFLEVANLSDIFAHLLQELFRKTVLDVWLLIE